jgi:beta-galactosidase GanA
VDGKPFLMLAGELHNSSASSLEYMEPMWDKLVALGLNTVLATVSWELVEPQEGQFDFSLVDGLVEQARRHNLRLVFLWFASWKNAWSTYVPAWVKKDMARFPRAQDKSGRTTGAVSPLCAEAMKANAIAFAAMMRHIRRIDEGHGTVLMMQIENETGLLGSSRDFSPHANEVFAGAVPAELMNYLAARKDSLIPELRKIWETAGFKSSGSWSEVFGTGPDADEIFMAWHIAKYIGNAAKAGKAEYPLPMFVNAWLIQHDGQEPGKYFSVHFAAASPGPKNAAIAQVWEGRYEQGRWIPGRCLNGDETGAHWQAKLPPNTSDIFANPDVPRILRVKLYRHE